MEAYVHGTSTRKVDDLVRALGVDAGISKSEVSRICAELDTEVAAFRSRSLAHTAFPYLFVDATYLKARVDGRVVSRAVVIATGVTADGGREVLGLDVGDSEDGAFWTAFLRSLKARGLAGVQLVISDAHTGLKQAIAAVMAGACWQRCRVHFLRNVLARVPRGQPRWSPRLSAPSSPSPPAKKSWTRSTRSPPCSPQVPPGRRPADRRSRGPHRLRDLPGCALDQDLVHQPAGARQQGDQAQDECRGHLPRRRCRAPAGRCSADRGPR
jgi:Transposase, Mutator family